MTNIADYVKATLYQPQAYSTSCVDLLVHPDDAEFIAERLVALRMVPRFKVITSEGMARGHMVVVDKLGVLTGLEELDR